MRRIVLDNYADAVFEHFPFQVLNHHFPQYHYHLRRPRPLCSNLCSLQEEITIPLNSHLAFDQLLGKLLEKSLEQTNRRCRRRRSQNLLDCHYHYHHYRRHF
jgi:hypothetical protein